MKSNKNDLVVDHAVVDHPDNVEGVLIRVSTFTELLIIYDSFLVERRS